MWFTIRLVSQLFRLHKNTITHHDNRSAVRVSPYTVSPGVGRKERSTEKSINLLTLESMNGPTYCSPDGPNQPTPSTSYRVGPDGLLSPPGTQKQKPFPALSDLTGQLDRQGTHASGIGGFADVYKALWMSENVSLSSTALVINTAVSFDLYSGGCKGTAIACCK